MVRDALIGLLTTNGLPFWLISLLFLPDPLYLKYKREMVVTDIKNKGFMCFPHQISARD